MKICELWDAYILLLVLVAECASKVLDSIQRQCYMKVKQTIRIPRMVYLLLSFEVIPRCRSRLNFENMIID